MLLLRKVLILALAAASVLGAGCADTKVPGVYRIDIQQGNVVNQQMLEQLEPGMEERKVRFILGSPLLVDVFNPNRWDYVYEFRPGGGDPVRRRISLFFADERLERISGDVDLADSPVEASSRGNETVVSVPDMPRKGGFFSALNPLSGETPTAASPVPSPDEATRAQMTTAVDEQSGDAPGNESAEQAASFESATPEVSAATPDPASQDEDGGFFRRLAERFGLGSTANEEPQPQTAQ